MVERSLNAFCDRHRRRRDVGWEDWPSRRRSAERAALITTAVMATMLVPVVPAAAIDEINTQRLRNAVTVSGILQHERAFQRIANENGGTRSSGTPGYQASVDYVVQRLRAANYNVSTQQFDFPFFEDNSALTVGGAAIETSALTFSGEGTITGNVYAADRIEIPPDGPGGTTESGCAATDFEPARMEPSIALVQRGTCNFSVKVDNALAAGYDAVIIFNEGQPGRTDVLAGTLGTQYDLPVIGISYEDGAALYEAIQAGPVSATVDVEVTSETRQTVNVIANSPKGDPNQVHRRWRAPRFGDGGPRDQRQRQRQRDDPRGRRGDGQARNRAASTGPIRVLGRRGVRPVGV